MEARAQMSNQTQFSLEKPFISQARGERGAKNEEAFIGMKH